MPPGLSVACPTCGVQPEWQCVDRRGNATRTHVARVKGETESPAETAQDANGPLAIPCPLELCQAPVGVKCRMPSGTVRDIPHTKRVRIAAEQQGTEAQYGVPVTVSEARIRDPLPTRLLDTIIRGDALAEMKKLPDGCVDLVVTSPPYNRMNTTGGGLRQPGRNGKWRQGPLTANQGYASNDDNLPVAHYVDLQRKVIFEAARLLAPGGAIFYNHSPRNQNSGQWEDLGRMIIRNNKLPRGFELRHVIVWTKPGGHNMKKGAFVRSYEEIFVLARRGEWKGAETRAITDVWDLGRDHESRGVPSFPAELPRRAMRCTPGGSVVLDPYMGSGTTAVAAVLEGWSYVGIELDAEMIEAANNRILRARVALTSDDSLVDTPPAAVDAPLDAPPGELASVDAPLDAPTGELASVDAPLDAPPGELASVDAPLDAPPGELASVDASLDAPPGELASMSENDRVTLAHIQAESTAQGNIPPVIDQADFPLPRSTTQRSLNRLKRAGKVNWGETSAGRRGPKAVLPSRPANPRHDAHVGHHRCSTEVKHQPSLKHQVKHQPGPGRLT